MFLPYYERDTCCPRNTRTGWHWLSLFSQDQLTCFSNLYNVFCIAKFDCPPFVSSRESLPHITFRDENTTPSHPSSRGASPLLREPYFLTITFHF